MNTLFLSYSTKDESRVAEIRDAIEAAGVPCWMANRDLSPGSVYDELIPTVIEDAQAVAVFLSAASIASPEVAKEVSLASKKRFFPIRLDDVSPEDLKGKLKYHLSDAQWVDAREDWQSAAKAVADAVKTVAGQAWAEGTRSAGSAAQVVKEPFSRKHGEKLRKTIVPGASAKMNLCADFITNKYRGTGYDVQMARIEAGVSDGVLIQIRNATTGTGRLFRTATGLTSCASLKLIPKGEDLEVEVMVGKWLDKIGAVAVSMVVLWPLLVTASIGAFRQKAMLDAVYTEALAWLSNHH